MMSRVASVKACASLALVLAIGLFVCCCKDGKTAMIVKSMSFEPGTSIPALHTCDGKDQSPHLQWRNLPDKTKSLALIVDDSDAPTGTFNHWVAWNLDPRAKGLKANVDTQAPETLLIQGHNGSGNLGYIGPCPAEGVHHYSFKLFALDVILSLPKSTTKEELEKAMSGHILGSAELMGFYQKENSR